MNILHPKLTQALEGMLLLNHQELKFYYHYLTYIDFVERNDLPMPTMGVGVVGYKLTCVYDRKFVEKTSVTHLTSILLHECLHLVHNHIKRTVGYNPKLSNIAQDMILNHIITDIHKMGLPRFTQDEVDEIMQKNPDAKVKVGDHHCVMLDPNYKGELIFEPLYRWLKEEHEKHQQDKPNELSQPTKDMLDSFANGMTTDCHMELDESERELKEQLGQEILEKAKMQMRGNLPNNVEKALELALKKPHNNNLSIIRKMIAATKGSCKMNSYRRLNKRVTGVKGKIKRSLALNVIWDTSGSMGGEHETVLSEIFRDGYEINLIQIDTAVNKVEKITRKEVLKKMILESCGGTALSPGISYILDPKNKLSLYPTVILTDGYTDTLDFKGSMNQFLILTVGTDCPIKNAPNVKQIKIEK